MVQAQLFEAVSQGDMKTAERFLKWADALQPKIDHAGRSTTQNPTPKRNREYQGRMHDCRNLERTQKALRALADAHQSGSVPESLASLKTRDEIAGMVYKSTTGGGGYYSVIECQDYSNTTPAARLLQGMIEGSTAQQEERNRLRKIEELEAEVKLTKIPGYFSTPAHVVSIMLDRAKIERGNTILEPSAGNGNIADAIRAAHGGAVAIHCYELNLRLHEILTLKKYTMVGSDFINAEVFKIYDRIIMNPPFEKQQDTDHVRRAFSFLHDGGILVSVMAPGFEFRNDRKSTEFREWLDAVGGTWEDLPDGAFKQSGTDVSTRLVVIQK